MLVFLSLTLFAVILCTALRMTCLCVKFFRRLPPRAPRTQRTPRRIDSHNLISPLRSLRTCFSPTFACFACHSFSPSTSKTNSTFVSISVQAIRGIRVHSWKNLLHRASPTTTHSSQHTTLPFGSTPGRTISSTPCVSSTRRSPVQIRANLP